MGGEIRDVDPVLDRFTLRAYGQKPMKILFDERTQVFRDGKRIPLRELRSSEHASIQTTLDGAAVFALSIHILSQSTPGDYEGEVLSFNPASGELTVGVAAGGEPFKLVVSRDTTFAREGQGVFSSGPSGPSDLQKGTLVSIKFDTDNNGHGVASRIAVLATPGSRFVFSGNVTGIDMHTGVLALVDPRDNLSYQVSFDSASIPIVQSVHSGQRVRVTAEYDGTHYLAREIMVY
jgi:hypothetical protein